MGFSLQCTLFRLLLCVFLSVLVATAPTLPLHFLALWFDFPVFCYIFSMLFDLTVPNGTKLVSLTYVFYAFLAGATFSPPSPSCNKNRSKNTSRYINKHVIVYLSCILLHKLSPTQLLSEGCSCL